MQRLVIESSARADPQKYRLRVLAGLPFRSGGVLEGGRGTVFTVARPATGALPADLELTVYVATPPPGGGPPEVKPFTFALRQEAATPDGLALVLTLAPDAEQRLWAHVEGGRTWRPTRSSSSRSRSLSAGGSPTRPPSRAWSRPTRARTNAWRTSRGRCESARRGCPSRT